MQVTIKPVPINAFVIWPYMYNIQTFFQASVLSFRLQTSPSSVRLTTWGYSFGWNHWDLWLWSFCVFGLCCRFNLCTCFEIWSCLHEIIYLGFLRTLYIYLKQVCVTFGGSSRGRVCFLAIQNYLTSLIILDSWIVLMRINILV